MHKKILQATLKQLLANRFVVPGSLAAVSVLAYFFAYPLFGGANRPAEDGRVSIEAPADRLPQTRVFSSTLRVQSGPDTLVSGGVSGANATPAGFSSPSPSPTKSVAPASPTRAVGTATVQPQAVAPLATATPASAAPTAAPSATPTAPRPTVAPSSPTPAPSSTKTPLPTSTRPSTPTSTPLPTNTAKPTATSVSGITRVVEPKASWNWAGITVAPNGNWAVTKVKMLDPCENHMMEVAFIDVQDEAGKLLDGIPVKYRAGDFELSVTSGDKGPGKAEIMMNVPMNMSVWVDRGSSDVATNLENTHIFDNYNIPMSYRICQATGLEGNAPKHLSYAVTFRRLR